MGESSTPRRPRRPGYKWCPACRRELSEQAFGSNRSSGDGLTSYCRPCHNASVRANRERHGGSRNYHLVRRYGITAAQYDEMFTAQGGLCDLCRERPAAHVDHCHATDKVRALLCFNCNQGLGNFRDDERTMMAAAEYVVHHRGGETLPVPTDPVVERRFRRLFPVAA